MSIFWDVKDVSLDITVSAIDLSTTVAETLQHYDPPTGIEVMAIGTTFIVA